MTFNLPLPPMTETDESRRYYEIRRYLFRLVEQLNNTIAGSAAATADESVRAAIDTASAELNGAIVRAKRDSDLQIDQLTAAVASRIKQGVIGYDSSDEPVLGIAIGLFLKGTGETEVIDGVVYDVIDTSGDLVTCVPGRLSLIVGGTEAAALSGDGLTLGTTTMSEAQLRSLLETLE